MERPVCAQGTEYGARCTMLCLQSDACGAQSWTAGHASAVLGAQQVYAHTAPWLPQGTVDFVLGKAKRELLCYTVQPGPLQVCTEPKAQRPNRYLPCLAARARRRQACAVAIRPAE